MDSARDKEPGPGEEGHHTRLAVFVRPVRDHTVVSSLESYLVIRFLFDHEQVLCAAAHPLFMDCNPAALYVQSPFLILPELCVLYPAYSAAVFLNRSW